MRELIASILEKQDQLLEENKELKCKCDRFESVLVANREMKESLEVIKKENKALVEKCNSYEVALKGLREECTKEQNLGGAVSDSKLDEWRKTWKKEQENEKVIFAEVVKKQIRKRQKMQ